MPQSRPDRLAAASLKPLGRKAVFTIADISSACVNERERASECFTFVAFLIKCAQII